MTEKIRRTTRERIVHDASANYRKINAAVVLLMIFDVLVSITLMQFDNGIDHS